MEEESVRRYCVIFQLKKSSPISRVAQTVPALVHLVDCWSKGNKEQVCRSNDGQLFGYFFKSSKPEAMMRSEFDASISTDNDDAIIMFEIGKRFTGNSGFSRAWTWLQHNQPE